MKYRPHLFMFNSCCRWRRWIWRSVTDGYGSVQSDIRLRGESVRRAHHQTRFVYVHECVFVCVLRISIMILPSNQVCVCVNAYVYVRELCACVCACVHVWVFWQSIWRAHHQIRFVYVCMCVSALRISMTSLLSSNQVCVCVCVYEFVHACARTCV